MVLQLLCYLLAVLDIHKFDELDFIAVRMIINVFSLTLCERNKVAPGKGPKPLFNCGDLVIVCCAAS